jgi:aryl-alcohol dehydrogenase-like predicted oxidoreductase
LEPGFAAPSATRRTGAFGFLGSTAHSFTPHGGIGTVTCAIIGARNMQQLNLILNGWSGPLPPEEIAVLDEASALPPLH